MVRTLLPIPPEIGAVLAATTEPTPSIPDQFGLAGLVVVPLISALVWYVRRSEARWEKQVEQANAARDRADERLFEYQEKVVGLLQEATRLNQIATAALERHADRGAPRGR